MRLSTGEERRYNALFVCDGTRWDPRWPEPAFPGHFDGTAIHSHYYRDAEAFRGKNVLVLGMGNSAMDISVECSYVANKVFLARVAARISCRNTARTPGRQIGSFRGCLSGCRVSYWGRCCGCRSGGWRITACRADHKLFECIPACRA